MLNIEDTAYQQQELVEINGQFYLAEEFGQANRELDEKKKTAIRLGDIQDKDLDQILKKVKEKFNKPADLLVYEDAALLAQRIKNLQRNANKSLGQITTENDAIYFVIDLMVRSGYGKLVINLFTEDFQFPLLEEGGSYMELLYNYRVGSILAKLAYKGFGDWIIKHLRNDFLDYINPNHIAPLVIQLFQSNSSNLLFKFLFHNYGEKGMAKLFEVFGNVDSIQTKKDSPLKRESTSVFNMIVQISLYRFEGYKFFELLPKTIDTQYLQNKHESFIYAIINLLKSGAYLQVKDRFHSDLENIDKNSQPSLISLVELLSAFKKFDNSDDLTAVLGQNTNFDLFNTLAREQRMMNPNRKNQTNDGRTRGFVLDNKKGDSAFLQNFISKIYYVRTIGKFDIFQVDNSGARTFIYRDNRTNQIIFSHYYKQESIREIISTLSENQIIASDGKNGNLYREHFLGSTVAQVMKMTDSIELKLHLEAQMNIILKKVERLGLNHRHPHPNNFNVRFMVKINDKQVCVYNLATAIELSKKYNSRVIPIVHLRDFDLIEKFPCLEN